MERLWRALQRTKARYWVFLDDDIEFLGGDVLGDCVRAMVRHRWAGCSHLLHLRPGAQSCATYEPWRRELLEQGVIEERDAGWMTGYFMLVDRDQVGDIGPDMNLPDPCTAIDTSYSVAIRARGLRLGSGSSRLLPHEKRGVGAEGHHPQSRAVSPRQMGHVLLGLRAVHGVRPPVAGRGQLAQRETGVPR